MMSDPRIDRNWRGLECNACGEYLPSLFGGSICTYCTIKDKDKRIAELGAENERLTDEFGDQRDENERLIAWLRHLTARVEELQEKDDE